MMGHELSIGDRVAYIRPRYHQIIWGIIDGFTAKMVEIERIDKVYKYLDKRPPNEIILDTRGWQRPR